MANEARLVFETASPIGFKVANATAVEKGVVMKFADEFTASASTGSNDLIAGISAQEKIASDGKTRLAIYTRGFFVMYASDSITVGDAVSTITGYPNYVISTAGGETVSDLQVLGHSLGTATNGQTVLVELHPSFGART